MKLHALNRKEMNLFASVSVRGVKSDKQYRTTILLQFCPFPIFRSSLKFWANYSWLDLGTGLTFRVQGRRAPVPRHSFQGDNPKSRELRGGKRPGLRSRYQQGSSHLPSHCVTCSSDHLCPHPLRHTSLLHTRHPARPLGSRPSKATGKPQQSHTGQGFFCPSDPPGNVHTRHALDFCSLYPHWISRNSHLVITSHVSTPTSTYSAFTEPPTPSFIAPAISSRAPKPRTSPTSSVLSLSSISASSPVSLSPSTTSGPDISASPCWRSSRQWQ